MSENKGSLYAQYMTSDNNLCSLVLPYDQLKAIWVMAVAATESSQGEGQKPKMILDMEHLQVADYASFPPITKQQQDAIRALQASDPIRLDEMAYLALRSLITVVWEKPTSEDDLRRASTFEWALEHAIKETSLSAGKVLGTHNAPLPYWGRLGFLRVMTAIPNDQIEAHDLQRFSCMLLKDPVFNARSFRYENHGLIGLNYALEPILKGLNRMLLHFFHTQELAGPKRLERVLGSLLPIVAHFWSRETIAVNRPSLNHHLFDEEMGKYAHAITASQVDFIIRHELGHLVLDHGRKLRTLDGDSAAKLALRHEFEFAADAFAQGGLRSELYSMLRARLQWSENSGNTADDERKGLDALHYHQQEVSGVRLLFMYMDVIDKAGQLLLRRLGDSIRFRPKMDSHPSARERINRLDALHIGEHPPTSPLLRYAETLFADTLAYADSLQDAELLTSFQNLYSRDS